MSESAEQVRRRILGQLILNAVTRWESIITLVATAILFLAVGDFSVAGVQLPAFVWLLLGGLAEAALIAVTISDPQVSQEAFAKQFENKYEINDIQNRVSRERLRTAFEYRRKMMQNANEQQGAMRIQLRQTVQDINDWIGHMYDLAKHIDSFEGNEILDRDLQMMPQKIEKVQIRIDRERDSKVRQDLEAQLRLLEQQKLNLEATKNSVRRAEIQLESTLSSLGTIFAQMSLLDAKDVDSSRAQRLKTEIRDEVSNLQDTIDAMDEVQSQRLMLS